MPVTPAASVGAFLAPPLLFGSEGCTSAALEEDAMEFDDVERGFYEDDLEEFERNQLANDRACERNDEEPLDGEVDDFGDLID